MKIKIRKYVYKKTSNIFISRIDCTAQNVLKLMDIFEFNNILTVIDAEDINPIIPILKDKNIVYSKNRNKINCPYTNVSFFTASDKFTNILLDMFKYQLEDIFIVSIDDTRQWEQYLNNRTYFQERKQINDNDPVLYISVNVNESDIEITMNNRFFDVSSVVSKIYDAFC